MRLMLTLFFLALASAEDIYRRVCFFTRHSRQQSGFTARDIDPTLCSHLIYVSGNLNPAVPNAASDTYVQMESLKIRNPSLKTLVSVGGPAVAPSRLTAMLSTITTRRRFVRSTARFLRESNLDGVNLDFVHLGRSANPREDKIRLTYLVQGFRRAFNIAKERTGRTYLITVSGPAQHKFIERGYDIPRISRVVDFFNLFTFDFHGGWESTTGHHAALFPGKRDGPVEQQLNVEWSVNFWQRKGAPKEKLVVGTALYGRGYTLDSSRRTGLDARADGPSFPRRKIKRGGFIAYSEVCRLLREGAVRHWIRDRKVPYLTFGNQWFGYDDRVSLNIKARWLKEQGLGGWMAWALEYDDVSGEDCRVGPYPLLTALNNALDSEVITEEDDVQSTIPAPSDMREDTDNLGTFCEGKADGSYPHPTSCRRYVSCVWGSTSILPCPRGLIFDPEWGKCMENLAGLDC